MPKPISQPTISPMVSTATQDFSVWTPELMADAMISLVQLPGWQLLKHILITEERDKAQHDLNTGDHKDLATVENLQYKIKVIDTLLALPEKIINIPQDDAQVSALIAEQGADPYYGVDDIAEMNKSVE